MHETFIFTQVYRFYVIQLLHPIGNDTQCTLYTRWGRVGENGQSQTKVSHTVILFCTRETDY